MVILLLVMVLCAPASIGQLAPVCREFFREELIAHRGRGGTSIAWDTAKKLQTTPALTEPCLDRFVGRRVRNGEIISQITKTPKDTYILSLMRSALVFEKLGAFAGKARLDLGCDIWKRYLLEQSDLQTDGFRQHLLGSLVNQDVPNILSGVCGNDRNRRVSSLDRNIFRVNYKADVNSKLERMPLSEFLYQSISKKFESTWWTALSSAAEDAYSSVGYANADREQKKLTVYCLGRFNNMFNEAKSGGLSLHLLLSATQSDKRMWEECIEPLTMVDEQGSFALIFIHWLYKLRTTSDAEARLNILCYLNQVFIQGKTLRLPYRKVYEHIPREVNAPLSQSDEFDVIDLLDDTSRDFRIDLNRKNICTPQPAGSIRIPSDAFRSLRRLHAHLNQAVVMSDLFASLKRKIWKGNAEQPNLFAFPATCKCPAKNGNLQQGISELLSRGGIVVQMGNVSPRTESAKVKGLRSTWVYKSFTLQKVIVPKGTPVNQGYRVFCDKIRTDLKEIRQLFSEDAQCQQQFAKGKTYLLAGEFSDPPEKEFRKNSFR